MNKPAAAAGHPVFNYSPQMEIHALSATAMLAAMERRELSSTEITTACFDRIKACDGVVHAFVHLFEEAALAEAARCDAERAAGQLRGPLHGLPISVKENLATAGTAVTLGVAARSSKVEAEDAVIVQAAKQAGAVVIGKTNMPLMLLAMESENGIWGSTWNPWDAGRVPGGSSGGEGAALAAGMSPLGLGTDIGGSIRIPAAWCGIAGLKPTGGRWSSRGQYGAMPGQENIRAAAGPLAREVADLALAMTALGPERQHALDPRVPPVPLPDPAGVDLRGLRIGVYEDDFFTPAASVRRAVREAADALRQAGAVLVPYTPPPADPLVQNYFGTLSADGSRTMRAFAGDQPPIPQLRGLMALTRMPAFARAGLAAALGAKGERRVKLLLDAFGEKTVAAYWALVAGRGRLQVEELAAWRAADVQLVLGPPTVTPPALPRETGDWSLGAWHTMRYNLLDLPAGVVPVSRVRPDEQQRAELGDRLDRKAATFEEHSAGLPVCAQIIGLPWEEHRVLAAMAAIEAACKGRPDFPRTPVDPRPAGGGR